MLNRELTDFELIRKEIQLNSNDLKDLIIQITNIQKKLNIEQLSILEQKIINLDEQLQILENKINKINNSLEILDKIENTYDLSIKNKTDYFHEMASIVAKFATENEKMIFGTINDQPIPPEDKYYHNNFKYYYNNIISE